MPRGFQFPDSEAELWVSITPVRPDLREEITARGNLGVRCHWPPQRQRKDVSGASRDGRQLRAAWRKSIRNQIETSE